MGWFATEACRTLRDCSDRVKPRGVQSAGQRSQSVEVILRGRTAGNCLPCRVGAGDSRTCAAGKWGRGRKPVAKQLAVVLDKIH